MDKPVTDQQLSSDLISILLFYRIIFPIQISQLPLESVLCLTLFGILNQSSGSSPDSNKQRKGPEILGQVSLPLFDFRR